MKPVFAKAINSEQSKVYWIVKVNQPVFYSGFHFHNECQLTYIIESCGRRIMGDNIENYSSGELTLLGANLPHAWHSASNAIATGDEPKPNAESITLFFDPCKIEELLSNFTNTSRLSSLLLTAKRGLLFYGETREKLKSLLLRVGDTTGFIQVAHLMEIFEILCHTSEYAMIASNGYTNTYSAKDNERFDRIIKYIFENFSKEIELTEIASIGNMNKQAFCRYFKARTQKTFVEFVNTVRIANACKLLSQSDETIGAIGYLSGFKSVSNFNKLFKLAKGVTPGDFKKMLDG
ncbi:MAG: helix-turn-helix domain-containing protein [Bacteroidetes bacterium]|nr:helix-turn-helix domain-containing protein [Bacteroidota bacterium]